MNSDEARREVGRLLTERDCSGMTGSMRSIANDYANYRYEMNLGMASALLKVLRRQPYWREGTK
jgi:hypothetical protein